VKIDRADTRDSGCMIPGDKQILKVCRPRAAKPHSPGYSRRLSPSQGSVFGLFLYLVFFGFSWLELPWLYPAGSYLRTHASVVALC
jgi:hypothetical protein